MTLSLQLFGAPALQENGRPLTLSRRKAMALLAYLAVTRSRHHRETLAALLWPESDTTAAFSALRNVLWILRQTPLSNAIHSDRSTVELVPSERIDVDVTRFRSLTVDCPSRAHVSGKVCTSCEPLLKEAVALWRGPFMQGFTVTNSIQFDDWQFAESEALRRELTETLDRLIDYHTSAENWPAAARYARQWLTVDSLNELSYRKLMHALAHQGKRSQALQVFDECSSVLMSELGLTPESSTVELAASIRDSKATAPSATKSQSHRLPSALLPLIGRRETVSRLEQLLMDDSSRIVTLVGLGGSGKSSLALHVGRRIEDQFTHGAVFVALDSLSSEPVVASTIAQALGIAHSRDDGSSLVSQLADYLRERNLLLILDGGERVLSQIVALVPILESATHVRTILTTRIGLDTAGEILVPVHGLEYPAIDIPSAEVTEYAAVRLLRISAQRRGNMPDDSEAELAGMARLARLLEGSPLGIEMAAGWRSMLTWEEIANRVSDKLEFLVQLREDIAPKHRAFAAVFEQAWIMLSDEAQAALRRLSVFRGSFTIDAAECVTEVAPNIVALLVNRCLVKRVGPKRYEIHELLRQFASGKLSSAGREIERARARHAEFYLRAVAVWFQKLVGPEQYATLERMHQDVGNIRLAFQHASSIGASDLLRQSCEGLFFYYDMCTQFEEAETVFDNAASAYAAQTSRDCDIDAFLSISGGWFAHHLWPDRATERLSAGLRFIGDDQPRSNLHAMAYVIAAYTSGQTDAVAHELRAQRSVEYYRNCCDKWAEGLATVAWASTVSHCDLDQAEALAYQGLRLHREVGDEWGEGLALLALARIAEMQGNWGLAFTRYKESQRLSEPIAADIVGVISAITGQACAIGRQGNAVASESLALRALQLSRGIGNRLKIGHALMALAQARRMLHDDASAKELLEEAFSLLTHRLWSCLQASCAVSLAEIALAASDSGLADRWLREIPRLVPDHPALPTLYELLERLRDSKRT